MARIRSIKPEFPQSESMGRITRDARLGFILLWTVADDEGRLRGNSRMLASLLFPYDADASKRMDGWLDELQRERCIRRYVVNGDQYIEICNWLKYQKIDKPSASKLPPFGEGSPKPPDDSAKPRERSTPEGKGREGRGVEARAATRAAGPTEGHLALARELGIPCLPEWERFWDHVDAKGKPWFSDANAAFRNWLRKARDFAEKDGRVVPLQRKGVVAL